MDTILDTPGWALFLATNEYDDQLFIWEISQVMDDRAVNKFTATRRPRSRVCTSITMVF